MRTTRSSSRWGGAASSPSTSPLGVSLDQIPLNFPGTSQKTAWNRRRGEGGGVVSKDQHSLNTWLMALKEFWTKYSGN